MKQDNGLQTIFGDFNRWNAVCVCALWLIFISPVFYRWVLYGTSSIGDVLVSAAYSVPLLVLLMGIRWMWVFFTLTLFLTYFCGNETFVVVVYHHFMKAANVVSMFITNTSESGSFVSNNMFAVLCDVPVLLLWFVALYAKSKAGKPRLLTLVCGILLLGALILCGREKVLDTPPYNLPDEFCEAYLFTQKKAKSSANVTDKPAALVSQREEGRESYVLFVGESVVYDHLSLGGYARPTTPLLDSCSNVTLYSDYYANATLTMLALPMMMSRATPQDFFASYSERNALGVFRDAGFKTFAIVCLNHLDSDMALSREADSLFICKRDIDIPALVDSLAEAHEKTFFVVQGLGNHCYFYNFEEEDNIFHPNAYYDEGVESDSLLYNAYDNTLRYTDRVLTGVIRAIDKEGSCSALLFASDHGENVVPGDERRSVSMHPMKSEYHVPLIFWRNERWKALYGEKDCAIEAHKDLPTSADDVFYSLCSLANISLNEGQGKEGWDLLSTSYKPHPRTLLAPDGRTVVELK